MNEEQYEDLHEKLERLQSLLRKRHLRAMRNNGPLADATRGQGRSLAVLKMKDGISTKDLSYLLGVRVSSLNETLAKMEKTGHIVREPSEQDKRVMLVKLTDKGREAKQPDGPEYGELFGCLTAGEQRCFGEYLDRIIEAYEAELGGEGDNIDSLGDGRERLQELAWAFGIRGRAGFGGHRSGGVGRAGFDPRMGGKHYCADRQRHHGLGYLE